MKAPWIVLSVVLAAVASYAGWMWHAESAQIAALTQQVNQLTADKSKAAADLAGAKEKADALESESAQLRAARAVTTARLDPADAAPSSTPDGAKPKGGPGGFLAKMMKDPEMRKMMAAQGASAMRGFYSDFVKQAHLSPDEAEQFFKLLQDRQAALMDSSASVMAGGAANPKDTAAAMETANDAMKSLLGADRFAQYQGFEKTLGQRIQVQQFSQQISATGDPLQDYQSQALIQIMSEEGKNMPGMNSGDGQKNPQQIMDMSPAQMDQYSQQVDAVNQKVYTRAMSVLTPPQLTAFKTYQQNSATAQLAGLKMAQQMFKGSQ